MTAQSKPPSPKSSASSTPRKTLRLNRSKHAAKPAPKKHTPKKASYSNVWRADNAPQTPKPKTPPTVKHPPNSVRLNKRLADMGLCSRREADDWIAKHWVFVNGELAEVGQRVQAEDQVHVDKKAYTEQAHRVTFLLHKPIGYVSGLPEDGHKTAAELLQANNRWQGDKTPMRFLPRQLQGLAPAGRLDIDSTGLLVFTQDGRIARSLIGHDSTVDKEYLVRVVYDAYNAPDDDIRAVFPQEKLALLRHGLSLDGAALKPAQVQWQNAQQLRFVLTEGKKRQIRRMCEQVGLQVVGLKRIRIGKIMLGNLPLGQWRFLGNDETFNDMEK